MPLDNTFPSSEFDKWAETYDRSISSDQFPFSGYERLLDKVVALAEAKPGMSILDLGTGTGNLATRFTALGCDLWCTDFSPAMLGKAHLKIPGARFILHDLRADLPADLGRIFDRIISAYVFHHFRLDEKIRIIRRMLPRLAPDGRMIIGDIAFPNNAARKKMKIAVGDEWEDEYYWIADQTLTALKDIKLKVQYIQVSSCAGIFTLQL